MRVSLFVVAVVSACSFLFATPALSSPFPAGVMSEDELRALLSPTDSDIASADPLDLFGVSRVSGGASNATCNAPFRLVRSMTLSSEYVGNFDDSATVDFNDLFFKVGLGWSEAQLAKKRAETLNFFLKEFGVPADKIIPITQDMMGDDDDDDDDHDGDDHSHGEGKDDDHDGDSHNHGDGDDHDHDDHSHSEGEDHDHDEEGHSHGDGDDHHHDDDDDMKPSSRHGSNIPKGSLGLSTVVIKRRLHKVSDSEKLVPCPNTTAILGGWVAEGIDVTYKGKITGGKAVKVPGESGIFVMYLIFAPGSRFSTKLELTAKHPLTCSFGGCALVANMKTADDFHGDYRGGVDGIIVPQESEKRLSTRMVLMWPGRHAEGL